MRKEVINIINDAQNESEIEINKDIKGIICDYFKNYYPNDEFKNRVDYNKKVKYFKCFDKYRNTGELSAYGCGKSIIIQTDHRQNTRTVNVNENIVNIKETNKDAMNKLLVYEKSVCFTNEGGKITLSGINDEGINTSMQIDFYYDLLKRELIILGTDIFYKDNVDKIENVHDVMYKVFIKSC